MFQYTKENILNVTTNPFEVKTDNGVSKLVIKGYGEYVLDNIVDKTVYKTEGKVGSAGTLTIPASAVTGKEVLLTFRVITPNQFLAEYASPNWQVFGKPLVIGMNAADIDDAIEAIKLAIPEGNNFITVEKSETNIVIKGTSDYMTFDKCYVEDVNAETKTITKVGTIVKNVEPFATKEWLIENLRFPTYPNIRYASAATMPTADVYTEYAFTYRVPRVGLGGLSGVGQALDAVTRHIFYVPKNVTVTATGLTFDAVATDDKPMLDIDTEVTE